MASKYSTIVPRLRRLQLSIQVPSEYLDFYCYHLVKAYSTTNVESDSDEKDWGGTVSSDSDDDSDDGSDDDPDEINLYSHSDSSSDCDSENESEGQNMCTYTSSDSRKGMGDF
jgi:hypothetical protein